MQRKMLIQLTVEAAMRKKYVLIMVWICKSYEIAGTTDPEALPQITASYIVHILCSA